MAFDFPTNPVQDQVYLSGGAAYVWDGEKWIMAGSAGIAQPGEYVLKAGDTMTGHLTLHADPAQPLHAATKQYVDLGAMPAPGLDGQALVAKVGVAVWGAPVNGGDF